MTAVYTIPVAFVLMLLTRWRFGRWLGWALIVPRVLACVVIGGMNTFLLKQVHAGVVSLAVVAVALIPVPRLLRASGFEPSRGRAAAIVVAVLASVVAFGALILLGAAPGRAHLPNGGTIATDYSWRDLLASGVASVIAGGAAAVPLVGRKRVSEEVSARPL